MPASFDSLGALLMGSARASAARGGGAWAADGGRAALTCATPPHAAHADFSPPPPPPQTRRKGTREHVEDCLILRMESGDPEVATDHYDAAVLLAAGRDPFALVEEAVASAASLSGGARPLRDKVVPPNIDVFGWCSWDR